MTKNMVNFSIFLEKIIFIFKKKNTFAIAKARVAELVDASVSKTDEVTLVPLRPRPRVHRKELILK